MEGGALMKITIAYTTGEELGARTVEEWCRAIFPGIKVRKSDRHPPYLHIYLTTKTGGKPRKAWKNS